MKKLKNKDLYQLGYVNPSSQNQIVLRDSELEMLRHVYNLVVGRKAFNEEHGNLDGKIGKVYGVDVSLSSYYLCDHDYYSLSGVKFRRDLPNDIADEYDSKRDLSIKMANEAIFQIDGDDCDGEKEDLQAVAFNMLTKKMNDLRVAPLWELNVIMRDWSCFNNLKDKLVKEPWAIDYKHFVDISVNLHKEHESMAGSDFTSWINSAFDHSVFSDWICEFPLRIKGERLIPKYLAKSRRK